MCLFPGAKEQVGSSWHRHAEVHHDDATRGHRGAFPGIGCCELQPGFSGFECRVEGRKTQDPESLIPFIKEYTLNYWGLNTMI